MNADEFSKILGRILNFLAVKERTRKEVEDKIDRIFRKDQEISPEEIAEVKDKVFKYLEQDNLIDDLEYAKTFVSQQLKSKKPKSRLQMIKFLIQRGVARDFIDEALTQIDLEFEIESAKTYLAKKLKTVKPGNHYKTRGKLFAYLASKGYSTEVINNVLPK